MDWYDAVQWGDVPTWAGAVATFGALCGAFLAARAAHKLYLVESKRDQDAERERHRTQASKVSAWYGLTTYRDDLPGDRQFWKATVRNSSDLPVYDLRVEFHRNAAANAANPQSNAEHENLPILAPGTSEFLDAPHDHRDYMIALRFRDAADSTWYRDTYGNLTEVTN